MNDVLNQNRPTANPAVALMKIKPLNNTEKWLLTAMSKCRGMLTAETLARCRYPQTQQIEKKRVTFTGYLMRLCKRRLARCVQGAFTITDAGRKAIKNPQPIPVGMSANTAAIRLRVVSDDILQT